MDINETLEILNLDENQRKEIKDWISTVALSTKLPTEKISEIFVNRTSEAIQAGLNTQFSFDQFMEYLRSMVISDTTQIIPPPPGIPIEYIPFGFFPTKSRKYGNQEEPVSEMIGYGKLKPENPIEFTSMTAFGNDAILKRNQVTFFNLYQTFIAFDPKKKIPGMIKGSIHEDTKFDSNIVPTPGYLPPSIPERQKTILKNFPLVPLNMAAQNLSKLITSDKQGGKKSNPYPDTSDLKTIQVVIQEFQTGRQKSGVEWGKLLVIDSSFVPTSSHKFFSVWIDPMIVRKAGTGPGSFVKILGILEFDSKQQYPQMTACSIIPNGPIKPLVEAPTNLGGQQQLTNTPSAAGRVVNISL